VADYTTSFSSAYKHRYHADDLRFRPVDPSSLTAAVTHTPKPDPG